MGVGRSRKEAGVGEEVNEVFVVLMVSLFYAIAAPSDFSELPGQWTGEIRGELGNQLMSICHLAG